MRPRFVIHAGFHKTGTTSIQRFLQENRIRLAALGFHFFQGRYRPDNHDEISGCCLRDERETGFKIRHKFYARAAFAPLQRVLQCYADSTTGTVVLSAEGISYLRFADEMAALDTLLPGGERRFVFYVRNREDWPRSFKAEIVWAGEPRDREAWNYTELDSWLLRFDERIEAFRKAFGRENVTVIDYDEAVEADGSVIPSFLGQLGIRAAFDPSSWASIWEHARFARPSNER